MIWVYALRYFVYFTRWIELFTKWVWSSRFDISKWLHHVWCGFCFFFSSVSSLKYATTIKRKCILNSIASFHNIFAPKNIVRHVLALFYYRFFTLLLLLRKHWKLYTLFNIRNWFEFHLHIKYLVFISKHVNLYLLNISPFISERNEFWAYSIECFSLSFSGSKNTLHTTTKNIEHWHWRVFLDWTMIPNERQIYINIQRQQHTSYS